jgi:hypothetical protein
LKDRGVFEQTVEFAQHRIETDGKIRRQGEQVHWGIAVDEHGCEASEIRPP